MANSKDRRKLRRQQTLGLKLPQPAHPAKTAPIAQEVIRIPWWKRIPKRVYFLIVFGTLIVTLLEGYPWLSIQRDDSLSSTNPFATTFSISNEGYVPVTDLNADCIFSFIDQKSANLFRDNTIGFDNFAGRLGHGDRVTTPCFTAIEAMERLTNLIPQDFSNSALTINISYAFMRVNLKSLRRSQIFRFKGISAEDKSIHWIFVQ